MLESVQPETCYYNVPGAAQQNKPKLQGLKNPFESRNELVSIYIKILGNMEGENCLLIQENQTAFIQKPILEKATLVKHPRND